MYQDNQVPAKNVLQTIHEMMANDPSIEASIIDDFNWDQAVVPPATVPAAPAPQNDESAKWEKFIDIGLFSSTNLPPFRKAKEISAGVKYPIRAMKKVFLKHGETVSHTISQSDETIF